jgi:hypothetical protein
VFNITDLLSVFLPPDEAIEESTKTYYEAGQSEDRIELEIDVVCEWEGSEGPSSQSCCLKLVRM